MAPDTASGILLLGGTGQLGHELQRTLAPLGPVVAPGRDEADLCSPEALRAVVRRYQPEVVVNAAAFTAVDRAEREPELAHRINEGAAGIIAEAAAAVGASVVHFSTDYVFDGRKQGAYVETDAAAPLSEYGRSKLGGEIAVARANPRNLVFRTSWVLGAHGTNFLRTMLRLGATNDTIRVVADQIGAPTSAALIADMTTRALQALRGGSRQDPRWGLYHLTASGETSWHGYARHVIRRAHEFGFLLKATPDTVVPITTAEYPVAAPRPANSLLDTTKFRTTFALDLPHWTHGVDEVLRSLGPSPRR